MEAVETRAEEWMERLYQAVEQDSSSEDEVPTKRGNKNPPKPPKQPKEKLPKEKTEKVPKEPKEPKTKKAKTEARW